MHSQSVQDYLKTIYKLEEQGSVSTTEIAKELNVSGASVTGMLKRLAKMKMVDYFSYRGVKLTESGVRIALEIIRHHRLLELYLKEELDFSLDKVHDEACRLEHYISDEFASKINEILGNPKFDPHGHPIPTKDGQIHDIEELSLAEVDSGSLVSIARLSDNDPSLLAHLEKSNLLPNVTIMILEKAPFNGPITIDFNGEEMIIGNEIAKNIFVAVQ